jgi:hypothetical protein
VKVKYTGMIMEMIVQTNVFIPRQAYVDYQNKERTLRILRSGRSIDPKELERLSESTKKVILDTVAQYKSTVKVST